VPIRCRGDGRRAEPHRPTASRRAEIPPSPGSRRPRRARRHAGTRHTSHTSIEIPILRRAFAGGASSIDTPAAVHLAKQSGRDDRFARAYGPWRPGSHATAPPPRHRSRSAARPHGGVPPVGEGPAAVRDGRAACAVVPPSPGPDALDAHAGILPTPRLKFLPSLRSSVRDLQSGRASYVPPSSIPVLHVHQLPSSFRTETKPVSGAVCTNT